jgi:hypothetical protein
MLVDRVGGSRGRLALSDRVGSRSLPGALSNPMWSPRAGSRGRPKRAGADRALDRVDGLLVGSRSDNLPRMVRCWLIALDRVVGPLCQADRVLDRVAAPLLMLGCGCVADPLCRVAPARVADLPRRIEC